MTCIAGVARDGHVWMGGDTLRSVGANLRRYYKNPKVWTSQSGKTRWIFGHSGSSPLAQIVQYHCPLPDVSATEPDELIRTLVMELVPAVREALKTRGELGKSKEDQTDKMASNFLFGVSGRLFTLGPDFSVLEPEYPYFAVGEGELPAFGALHALHRKPGHMAPPHMIRIALEAAELTCSGVGTKALILKI